MMNNKTAPFGVGSDEIYPGKCIDPVGISEDDMKAQIDRILREQAEKTQREYEEKLAKMTVQVIPPPKDGNPKDQIADNKLPMHLVSGIVKAYQAIAHFLGNVKYGAWNYRVKGARASVYRSALDRHMDAWWEGEDTDPVDGTPHLANALACINILIEASEIGRLEDDRPPKSNYRKVVTKLTALMPKIREQYKDRNPIHYQEKQK